MKLTSFYVSNFKGLREAKFDNLNGINVIVGYNGYGKTNVLSAIYMFLKNMELGLDKKAMDDPNQEYILWWKDYDISKPIIMSGKLLFPAGEAQRIADTQRDISLDVSMELTYSKNQVSWKTRDFLINGRSPSGEDIQDIRKFLAYVKENVDYIPIFDQNFFEQTLRKMAEMNRSPINLRKYWYDFVNLTSKVIPEIKGLEFWEFKKLVLNVYNTPIYIDIVASGFQKVVLMLFVLWLSANKILLIEEPEVNMHPLLQIKVSKLIRKWADEDVFQVFLTTHSPYFTSQDIRKFIIMRRNGTYGTAHSLDITDELKLTMSMLGISLSDLLFSRTIILTGEQLEPPLVNAWLYKISVDPEELGIKVFKVRGDIDLQLWLKIKDTVPLRIMFLGLCEKLNDNNRDSCVSFNKDVETFYDRNVIINILKEMGIYPDDKEMRELGKDDISKWILGVMKRRGYEYSWYRENVSRIIAEMDNVEVPREIEVLANKIKSVEV
ncbi:ATPase [Sulfolobales archaeon HS-7]|nr:ATPase [Sulfolobales archaeon HS-7]